MSRPRTDAPVAVALIMRSMGELHCLLPILAQAKQLEPDLRIVVVFRERSMPARLAEDPVYSAILAELGAQLLHLRSLLRQALADRARIRIIFKDFGAAPAGSLGPVLKRFCPNAALVLFPHAYAIHSISEGPAVAYGRGRDEYDQKLIDAALLNTHLDVGTWSHRVPEHAIQVVGATGYTDWWRVILSRHAREQLKSVVDAAGDKKIVFLTTRGPHEAYLTDENYRYLVPLAVETILARPDVVIMLKPHPREDVAQLKALLAGYPSDRVKVTALNTLALASISTVNVSFWSSAVLDAIASGTPTIELYRFHRPNGQTVLDADGNIASIYTTLGLSLRAVDRETLAEALDVALSQRDELLARQRAVLARCFPDNEARLDTLRSVLGDLLRAPARRTSVRATVTSMLKLARMSARDLVDDLRERTGYGS
jgi:hypothetical protein